jgi:hypothetical protein
MGGNNSSAHTAMVNAIRLELGQEPDLTLWAMQPGGVADATGRPMRCGPTGMADLCGVLAMDVVLYSLPGHPRATRPTVFTFGRWFCLEVKTGRGVLSPEQRMWHNLIRLRGGFACEVRSVDDAKAALVRCRMGLDS